MSDQAPTSRSRWYKKKWPVVLLLTALLFTGAYLYNRRLLDNTLMCIEGSTADQADCDALAARARHNQRIQQVILPTSIIVYRLAGNGPVSSTTQQVFLYGNILFYFLVSELVVSVASIATRRRGNMTT